jgi:hypothetical protein
MGGAEFKPGGWGQIQNQLGDSNSRAKGLHAGAGDMVANAESIVSYSLQS